MAEAGGTADLVLRNARIVDRTGRCGSHKSYRPQKPSHFWLVPDSVLDMRTTIQFVLAVIREAFLSRAALHLENLALRHSSLPP